MLVIVWAAGSCGVSRLDQCRCLSLTPYLEDALAPALGGRRIHVQNAILAWDVEADSLELRARQVTIRQRDDTPLATIPTIDVKLSAGALLRGTVALTAINIEESRGVLIRPPEGTFQCSADSAATPPSEPLLPEAADLTTAARQSQVIADLVQNLVAEPGALSPLATLQELRVAKGTLVSFGTGDASAPSMRVTGNAEGLGGDVTIRG